METQKIANLLNSSENEPIKFLTRSIESSLSDYSDAYILVKGNINSGGNDTKATFKNCAPFRKHRAEINETFIDKAEHVNIVIPMYNLIEYSDNYSDTSGSLWHFNRDEQSKENNGNLFDLSAEYSSSFKYKSNLIGTRPNG